MSYRANGTRANDHRANGNRADVVGQLRSTLENISISFDSSSSKDVNGVIKNLISAVQNLTDNLSGLQNKMEMLENRFRSQ